MATLLDTFIHTNSLESRSSESETQVVFTADPIAELAITIIGSRFAQPLVHRPTPLSCALPACVFTFVAQFLRLCDTWHPLSLPSCLPLWGRMLLWGGAPAQ